MNNFIIVSNEIKDKDLEIAKNIKAGLIEAYENVSIDICEMEECQDKDFNNYDCILVLGGDGTLLRVAKDTVKYNAPVIGINLGALGYLAEVELDNVVSAVGKLIAGEYHIEERMMIEGHATYKNGEVSETISALNDIVLSRRLDLQIIGYRISVNGIYLTDFYADGVIVSTPTGSTGYNMSAGGSIVEPLASLMVLTPVCPHTLNTRSIMLSPDDEVVIEILEPKGDKSIEVGAYYDGGSTQILASGDKVTIKRSSRVTKICKISDMGFLEILHKKMNG